MYNPQGDVLTEMSEITYTRSSTSTASAYSLERNSTNSLIQSLLGDNYKKVDLTANALFVPSTNTSTYSTNSVTTNSTTLCTIGFDEIANITNLGDFSFAWNGRRLESISQNGTELISYKYNIDGQRISKTAPDVITGETVTTEYFYNGSILAGQKKGDNILVFMYDNNGDVFGFTYNGTPYYYVKNAQNDVWAIADELGELVVLYQYDAWGVVTACYDITEEYIATVNPITYRSYYMDIDLGFFMYYLNSRYYLADWGRFVSADSYVQTGQGVLSNNMFAYCMNNPVIFTDEQGTFVGTIFGAIVGGIAGGIGAAINGDNVLAGVLIGASTGALAGAAVDIAVATGGVGAIAIAAIGGAVSSGINYVATEKVNGREISTGQLAVEATVGAVMNTLSFGLAGGTMAKQSGKVLVNMKNSLVNEIMENTQKFVAGKVIYKSGKKVVENIAKNISYNFAEEAVVSFGSSLISSVMWMQIEYACEE